MSRNKSDKSTNTNQKCIFYSQIAKWLSCYVWCNCPLHQLRSQLLGIIIINFCPTDSNFSTGIVQGFHTPGNLKISGETSQIRGTDCNKMHILISKWLSENDWEYTWCITQVGFFLSSGNEVRYLRCSLQCIAPVNFDKTSQRPLTLHMAWCQFDNNLIASPLCWPSVDSFHPCRIPGYIVSHPVQ